MNKKILTVVSFLAAYHFATSSFATEQCGALQQDALKIDFNKRHISVIASALFVDTYYCDEIETPINANATILYISNQNKIVYQKRTFINRMKHYDIVDPLDTSSRLKGGVLPAQTAVLLIKIPRNDNTKNINRIQIQFDDGTSAQTSSLGGKR